MARWFPLPPKIRTILVPGPPTDSAEVDRDKVRFDIRERLHRFRDSVGISGLAEITETFRTSSTEALVLLVSTVDAWLPRESVLVRALATTTERLTNLHDRIFIGLRTFETFRASDSLFIGTGTMEKFRPRETDIVVAIISLAARFRAATSAALSPRVFETFGARSAVVLAPLVRETFAPRETDVVAAIITEASAGYRESAAIAPRTFETFGARDNGIALAPRTFEPVRFNVLDQVSAIAAVEAHLRAMTSEHVGVRVFEKFKGGPVTLSMFLEMNPTATVGQVAGQPFFWPTTVQSQTGMTNANNILGDNNNEASATVSSSGIGGITSNTNNYSLIISFRDLVTVDGLDLFADITRFRLGVRNGASSTAIAVGASSSINGDHSFNAGSSWINFMARSSSGGNGNIANSAFTVNATPPGSWAGIQDLRFRISGHVTSGTGVGASCTALFMRAGFNLDAERLNF